GIGFWFYPHTPDRLNVKSNVRLVAADGALRLKPGDLVLSTHPEQVPVIYYYLNRFGEHHLRYATELGYVPDLHVMHWRDCVTRLRAPSTRRTPLPFAVVLGVGALLRVACEIAYRPALFYSDSWGYLSMAHGHSLVTFAPLRPSGYPVALKVLAAAGNGLLATTLVQHLAGLATGLLAYATLWHLGVRRWLAT